MTFECDQQNTGQIFCLIDTLKQRESAGNVTLPIEICF